MKTWTAIWLVLVLAFGPVARAAGDELHPEHDPEEELHPGEVEYVVDVGLIEKVVNWTAGVLGTVLAGWYITEELDVNDKDPAPDPAKKAAAEQAEPPVAPVGEYDLRISGMFLGSPVVVDCGTFTPGLTFSPDQPGVITAMIPSTCKTATAGGQWRPGYGAEIVLALPDPFYTGIAQISGTDIILPSGSVLRAAPGASITVTRRELVP